MIFQILLKRSTVKLLRRASLLSLGWIFACSLSNFSLAASDIHYQAFEQPSSIVHTVTIAARSDYLITTSVAAELVSLKKFATANKAVAAINGGYFDPQNQKTTSYITKNNSLAADPRLNERLIDNPDLKQYLGKILNRAEFRRYRCAETNRYDITSHSTAVPDGCVLQDALGAGPQLLPLDTSIAEGFVAYENNQLIRDAIGINSLNARSAVAITAQGDIIFAMVEQTTVGDSGMSLPSLASFLQGLGAVKAMNLDGGSSSSLYYQGQIYYGKLNRQGNQIERPLKSTLIVF